MIESVYYFQKALYGAHQEQSVSSSSCAILVNPFAITKQQLKKRCSNISDIYTYFFSGDTNMTCMLIKGTTVSVVNYSINIDSLAPVTKS